MEQYSPAQFANFQKKFKLSSLVEGNLPIPTDQEGVLLDSSDVQVLGSRENGEPDAFSRSSADKYYALYRTRLNGLDAYLVHATGGWDVTLYFFKPDSSQFVGSQYVASGSQDRCWQHLDRPMLIDLDRDGKLDLLLQNYVEGSEDGQYGCTEGDIQALFWRGDHFESLKVPNTKQLRGRYFGDPCKKEQPRFEGEQVHVSTSFVSVEVQHGSLTPIREEIGLEVYNQMDRPICLIKTPTFSRRWNGEIKITQAWPKAPSGWKTILYQNPQHLDTMQFVWKAEGKCLQPRETLKGLQGEVVRPPGMRFDSNVYEACFDSSHCIPAVVSK